MPSRKLVDSHPRLQAAFMQAKQEWEKDLNKPKPFITCSYRSPEEQHLLFCQPTDGKDNDKDGKIDEADEKVTNADSNKSLHNSYPSKAIDLAFLKKDGKLDWTVKNFEDFFKLMKTFDPNLRWGGTFKFKDYCHVEII